MSNSDSTTNGPADPVGAAGAAPGPASGASAFDANAGRPAEHIPATVAHVPAAGTLPMPVPQFALAPAPRPVMRPPAPPATPTLTALLKALRRRWMLAATLGILVAAVTATAVWFYLPPGKHTAFIKLHMPANPPSLPGFEHPEAGVEFQAFQRTQFALMHTRPVLNAALRDPRVKDINFDALARGANAVDWLDGQIRIDMPDGPELPRVVMVGDNPEQLKALVNAVVDAYLTEVVEKDTTKNRLERIDKLKDIRQLYFDRVKRFNENHRKLAEAAGAGQDQLLALKQELGQREMAAVKGELVRTDTELRRLTFELRMYEGKPYLKLSEKWLETLKAQGVPEAFLTKVAALKDKTFDTKEEFSQEVDKVFDDAERNLYQDHYEDYRGHVVDQLELKTKPIAISDIPDQIVDAAIDKALEPERAARDRLASDLEQVRQAVADENNFKVRQLRENIRAKDELIAEQRKKLRPTYKQRMLEKAQTDSQSQVVWMKEQLGYYKELKRTQEKQLEDMAERSKGFLKATLDMEENKFELAQAQKGLEKVSAAIDTLNIELPAPPRVKKWEEVQTVAPDETSRKMKMAGMGGLGAFGAIVLLVSFLEWRARRLDSADDVVQGLGLELMGTLPAAPRRLGGRWTGSAEADAAHWQSSLAESVDSARTLLLRAAGAGSMKVVMVTSATSGEGKTSLAAHLAASLARAGHKTLLLDGDLRKPTTHLIFDMEIGPGFSEVLRGEADLAAAVRPTKSTGLSLLPAGLADDEAIQQLARGPVAEIMARLKQEYEFIVVDSAPVLPVADSLLLAQHADGVLLSLFHEVSRLPQVYAAYQRLHLLRARVLGVVMNGARDGYGYGYSYGYGYGYGYGHRRASAAAQQQPENSSQSS